MRRVFKSIAFPEKYGYAFDSDAWEYRSNPFLTSKFRMFETYGDGLCQHSHDWPVTEEYAIDYLYSLAMVVVEDSELGEHVEYHVNHTVENHKDTQPSLAHKLYAQGISAVIKALDLPIDIPAGF